MNWKQWYINKGQEEKMLEIKKNWKKRWRKRTGSFKYPKRKWTKYEDSLVLAHEIEDRQLSEKIGRSAQAIQARRWRLTKGE